MNKKDVEHLAELSRIELSGQEVDKFQEDLGSVLEYVDQVKKASVSVDSSLELGFVHNAVREDENPYKDGKSREEIINSFPEKDGDYLKVKKIIS